MQVLGTVIILAISLIIGLGGIVLSIVGLIISRAMKRAGRAHGKTLTAISAVVLVFSLLMTVIPASFFGFIYHFNSTPPMEYVETNILVERSESSEEFFTANGLTYRALDFEPNTAVCREKGVAVFSYKPEGFLNRHLWQNYYRIETGQDFDLIWDGNYILFCTDEDRKAILDYYSQPANTWCAFDHTDYDPQTEEPPSYPLSAETTAAMETLIGISEADLPSSTITLTKYRDISIEGYSMDGVVSRHYYSFYVSKDGVYSAYDIYYAEDGTISFTGYRLPDEIGAPIMEQFGNFN